MQSNPLRARGIAQEEAYFRQIEAARLRRSRAESSRRALRAELGAELEIEQATVLLDDLIELGVSCFNPFQPEVMDIWSLLPRYRGRLAFHGGLSTQRTLPFGSADEVRAEVGRLLRAGRDGGYIFAPAHDVEGDVPLENMLAAIEVVQSQTT